MIQAHSFPDGLTVTELKKAIADWPEIREDGSPTKVLFGNRYPNRVKYIWPLNVFKMTADMLLVAAETYWT